MCPFPVDSDPIRPCESCDATEGAEPYRFDHSVRRVDPKWSSHHVICDTCATLARADGYAITLIDQWDGPSEDGDPCVHCRSPIWYCDSEEQYFHIDPEKTCFLKTGKTPPKPAARAAIALRDLSLDGTLGHLDIALANISEVVESGDLVDHVAETLASDLRHAREMLDLLYKLLGEESK